MIRKFLIAKLTMVMGCISAQTAYEEEWLQTIEEPVVIRYHRQDEKTAATVMKVIQDELPRIAGDLRLDFVKRVVRTKKPSGLFSKQSRRSGTTGVVTPRRMGGQTLISD